MKRVLMLIALLVTALPAFGAMSVGAAWVREPNPARDLTGGFMRLTNHGTVPVKLVRVTSPVAEVVEMHETRSVDGMSSMRRVESIVIPPGERVQLEPGGLHLMLIRLTQKVPAGARIPMVLEFDDGTAARIEAEVRGEGGDTHHHHAH